MISIHPSSLSLILNNFAPHPPKPTDQPIPGNFPSPIDLSKSHHPFAQAPPPSHTYPSAIHPFIQAEKEGRRKKGRKEGRGKAKGENQRLYSNKEVVEISRLLSPCTPFSKNIHHP
ncbi:hypothetical protein B9Z19DRAFT_1087019 [Tuber borchii]|uniref:Uncharacterized protein n=1 Tax=Tuber borchii TaxID=42251 RepID=A0A2T6ZNH4_TUBBO|nr:hypothetical protein B9Z19DRAFT_1087019 [Tuber borchii]